MKSECLGAWVHSHGGRESTDHALSGVFCFIGLRTRAEVNVWPRTLVMKQDEDHGEARRETRQDQTRRHKRTALLCDTKASKHNGSFMHLTPNATCDVHEQLIRPSGLSNAARLDELVVSFQGAGGAGRGEGCMCRPRFEATCRGSWRPRFWPRRPPIGSLISKLVSPRRLADDGGRSDVFFFFLDLERTSLTRWPVLSYYVIEDYVDTQSIPHSRLPD